MKSAYHVCRAEQSIEMTVGGLYIEQNNKDIVTRLSLNLALPARTAQPNLDFQADTLFVLAYNPPEQNLILLNNQTTPINSI